MTNPIRDISGADFILAIGTNTTESHPIIGLQVKKAVREGSLLVVVDPRKTEVAELAYLYLQLTGIRLVGIMDEQKTGKNFFSHVISGLERVREDDWDMILVTRLDDSDEAVAALVERGVDQRRVARV